ncbi:MAG: HD domain-containing protein [Candidatus Kaiserbacteria bacterium]|nr:HD domain-containing protein [Candidatus Kaiserbacteria bacterium]
MLERIRGFLTKHPDRAAFFRIIGRYFPRFSPEYLLIEKAYKTAKDAFRSEVREGGERYFEHLRAVALILILYLRVRDANVIAAALLHDIVEDIEFWNQERIALEFNPAVAQLVFLVTKDDVVLYDGDKEARNREYHRKLATASREAIIIKLADRLHNIITLWVTSEDKQRRKVRETQDFYLPLAETHIILIHELEAALEEVMGRLSASQAI